MKPKTDWKDLKEEKPEPTDSDSEEDSEDVGRLLVFDGQRSDTTERVIDFLYPHFNHIFLVSTNFRITATIYRAIKDVEGIEAIQILTPYRMRIAIGDLFDVDQVRVSVNRKINGIFSSNTG